MTEAASGAAPVHATRGPPGQHRGPADSRCLAPSAREAAQGTGRVQWGQGYNTCFRGRRAEKPSAWATGVRPPWVSSADHRQHLGVERAGFPGTPPPPDQG